MKHGNTTPLPIQPDIGFVSDAHPQGLGWMRLMV